MNSSKLTIANLEQLCADGEEESLTLEFKSCDELRVGSPKTRGEGNRSRDDVINELSKDVSALLNAAGGRIIYGIREKKSRAKSLDDKTYTSADNLTPEKLVDWLRAHIQPPPNINAYRVLTNPDDGDSPWYFVIEVEQGQQAYMAQDNRFYKRVGATVKPMEQYEVVDTMNRSKGALLDIKWEVRSSQLSKQGWHGLTLNPSITSTNLISSEHGNLKLTVGSPMQFININNRTKLSRFESGIKLDGYDDVPTKEEALINWSMHQGVVIYPGDWRYFDHIYIRLEAPLLNEPATYLLQAKLLTAYALPQKRLYAIQDLSSNQPQMVPVTPDNYNEVVGKFWETFYLAHKDA